MKKITITISFLFLIVFNTTALSLPVNSLSLAQLIQVALQNNQALKAAFYNLTIAKGQLIQARLIPNPILNLTKATDAPFNDEGEYTKGLGLTEDIPISGRIKQQTRVAEINLAIAKITFANLQRQLQAEVASLYYALIINHMRLQQINRMVTINYQLAKVTSERYKSAEVSELDANTAQIEYFRFIQESKMLKAERIKQLAELYQLLGQRMDGSLSISETLPVLSQLPSINTMQVQALSNRQDLQAAWLAIDGTQAGFLLARTQRYQDWTVGVGLQEDQIAIEGLNTPQPADKSINFSLSIPLPLFNRNQGQIVQMNASRLQAVQNYRSLQQQIMAQVMSDYYVLNALQQILLQSQSQLLRLSQKNIRLAQSAYQTGQLSIFDVVQVERQQNDTELSYLNTLNDYLQAYVQLQTTVGNKLN